MDMAQSDSRTPRKPYACNNKRKFARRSVRTLRGGRLSRPLSGGSKHMLSAGRTSVCVVMRKVSKRHIVRKNGFLRTATQIRIIWMLLSI
jgi:hypothetical protein